MHRWLINQESFGKNKTPVYKRSQNIFSSLHKTDHVMKNNIKQSFRINTKLMRYLSWYPSKNYSLLFMAKGYILFFVFMVLVTALTIVKIIVEKRYDNMQVIYVSEALSYCFKLLSFLRNGEQIKKCINYFNGPAFAPKDEVENAISETSVKLCRRISLAYILAITCSALVYAVPSLFLDSYYIPLNIWLPYDPVSTAVKYYPTFLYIIVACMYAGLATSLIDPLIGGLAFHAVSQLKILKHRLRNVHISTGGKENIGTSWNEITIYENLIKCIQHHNIILEFVDEYEKSFSIVIFSQFVGSTFFVCFCCIGLSTVSFSSVDAVAYCIFFFLANSQLLFFCFFGTLLHEENNTLITAIYMSQWYEYNVKAKKLLIILMERSKRPMIVTAEKLIDVTLETFAKIMRRSYSLVAVLK